MVSKIYLAFISHITSVNVPLLYIIVTPWGARIKVAEEKSVTIATGSIPQNKDATKVSTFRTSQ